MPAQIKTKNTRTQQKNVAKTTLKKTSRVFWADALRTVAILMVVTIHSSAPVLYSWNEVLADTISIPAWNFANILNAISRISIPLFVMLSGTFLLKNTETVQMFLKKRIPRIILPWLVWGTIQLLYNYDFYLTEIFDGSLAEKVGTTFFGGFWFMPLILGLYLISPIIKSFVQTAQPKDFYYFFALWFVVASLIPTLNQSFGINISYVIPTFIQYLGYFVAGYFLVHKTKISEKILKQTQFLFVLSCALIALGTYSLTSLAGDFHSSLYEYTNVLVLVTSVSGFVTLKSFFEKRLVLITKDWQQKITKISQASLGIFLSHALILDILTTGKIGITIHALQGNTFVFLPITIVLVFGSSLALVLLLQKYFRKFVS